MQIEEVKLANRIILAAKCHVVRRAQMNETQELNREQREVELQLEQNILNQCEKALAEEKRRQHEMKLIKKRYANELRQQLKNRKMKTFLEAKRIEEEAIALSKAKTALLKDHEEKQRAKQSKINYIREAFRHSTEMTNFFKNLEFEKQRIAEMKSQEYMRMRQERDIQIKQDRRLEQERKQREVDRLLTLQTKFLQMKNEQESKMQRRIQEEKEREFRLKERLVATRRKENEQHVNLARGIQIAEMQQIRQIRSATDKKEYDQVMNELKLAEKQDLENKRKMSAVKEKYRNGKKETRMKSVSKPVNETSAQADFFEHIEYIMCAKFQ